MKFIRRKNMLEGEELLYAPQVHWLYTIKQVVWSLPFFVVLFFLLRISISRNLFIDVVSLVLITILANILLIASLFILLVFLWRIFLYLSIEYGVTNKRLIMKKGLINLSVAEIPIDRIESIYCFQGLIGRLFRYGTVYISGVGGRLPVFNMVYKPYALRRKIVEIIEKNKIINVIHGDLPKPVVKPPEPEYDPIYLFGTFVRVLPKNQE
ncbi:MAG: PH domain-containing protein [Treponema sp.]|jgi:membrane protein YdbS with pleckstrin-like domain|nr:PH domain-containing protein [Treponema sp.]